MITKLNKVTSVIMSVSIILSICIFCSCQQTATSSFNNTSVTNNNTTTESDIKLETTPVENFEYEIIDGEMSIEGYTGNDTEIVIPDVIDGINVTQIGLFAFQNTNLTSVIIPDTVTKISQSAFDNCKSLSKVYIPDSVIEIGHAAFIHSSQLKEITIADRVHRIESSAFLDCTSLEKVCVRASAPDTNEYELTELGESAFGDCTNLREITIPSGITEIHSSALNGCVNLESITLPNSLQEIGKEAFDDTKWYKNQPEGLLYLNHISVGVKGNISESNIMDGTSSILGLGNFESLSDVYIPESVEYIQPDSIGFIYQTPDMDPVTGMPSWGDYSDNITIRGKTGSVAETYAKENNLNFVAE